MRKGVLRTGTHSGDASRSGRNVVDPREEERKERKECNVFPVVLPRFAVPVYVRHAGNHGGESPADAFL